MARILVIDDEEPVRSLIKRGLEHVGHEVEEAEDGDQGTRLFQASPFDLVITDLIMPEKEGIETILDLRESHPNVRILVISGGLSFGGRSLDRQGPLSDAEALGADASLAKPFDLRKLIEVVDELLARPG
jgi:DNA-binding response OmpR family regulator